MKITADTNLLVRAIVGDNEKQADAAQAALAEAELVALTLPALCELVWVLSHGYRYSLKVIEETMRELLSGNNLALDRPAAEAGLRFMELGGDFADGVIAFQGKWLGAETFVSFDKKAVNIVQADGGSSRLLA